MKKKVLSRSHQKKRTYSKHIRSRSKQSITSWLVALFILACGYGYYSFQPKNFQIIQLVGELADYVSHENISKSEPLSINAVRTCQNDPECADLVDASRRAGAPVTLQQQSQSSIRVAKDVVRNLEREEDEEDSSSNQNNAVAEALNTASSIIVRESTPTNDDGASIQPSSSPFVPGLTCKTDESDVQLGETILGTLLEEGKYQVLECTPTGWNPDGCVFNTDSKLNVCYVSLLPAYMKPPDQQNCYENNILIGHGSLVGTDKQQECDNGEIIPLRMALHPPREICEQAHGVYQEDTKECDLPPSSGANSQIKVEDNWIQSQAECREARGSWSELLSECITGVVIIPPTTEVADSTTSIPNYSQHPYIDFQAREELCDKRKGVYFPEIDYCKTMGVLNDWVENERRKRACDYLKGTYDESVGHCTLPAGGSIDFYPYFIPTNLDYSDPVNQGVLGHTADNVADSVSRCQRNNWGSGDELYTCLCALIDCRPGSAGQDIASYLATNSQDANGVSDMDLVNAIVGKTTDKNSLVCGSAASDVGKNCLPKEPTGWYSCDDPSELYADDIVVIRGDADTNGEDITGICTDAVGSATCNVADSGFYGSSLAPSYVDVHPISAGEIDRVVRKLPDGDRRAAGCWASSNIQMEDYVAPDR